MSGLWIYGAIPPEPTGGVSTFVERLVRAAPVAIAGVIDPYPGRKNPVAVKHIFSGRAGTISKLKIISYLFKLRSDRLLVNVSRPQGAVFLAPFLLGRRAPAHLIMHHGNLQSPSGLRRYFLKTSLMRYAAIGCLSEKQRVFYRELGVPDDRLKLINTNLPPVVEIVNEQASPLSDVLEWLRQGSGPLIVASGYAEDYYNHDWLYDALNDRAELSGARALICCYGPKTPLLDSLMRRAEADPRLYCVYGLSAAQFGFLLNRADVYARPTNIDSFGIAVWDAANDGKAIVASDACSRPAGTYLHPVGNKRAFEECLVGAVLASPREGQPIAEMEKRVELEEFLSG